MEKIYLSVVIPAYNEEKNIKSGVLEEIYKYLLPQKYSWEVLLVNDGSTDNTLKLLRDYSLNDKRFKVLNEPHRGKAGTVISGMLVARGEVILFTDMDQATPIDEVEKFFPKFKGGYDVVIGSRHGRKGAPVLRKLAAWGFATLRNVFLGIPFVDTQCGFKAFTKKARQEIFTKMLKEWNKMRAKGAAVNAGFDVEALFLAKKMGFEVAEVDVDWHYVGTERVQLVKDSLDAIKDMIRIRWNDLNGKYN